jgi:hypothetical protein
LPAGRDFTAHVPPVGGVVVGGVVVVGGRVVGGVVVGGRVVGGAVVGGRVVVVGGVPVQAPRSRHSEAASTGFQPAPGGGVCATSAWYRWPL